MNNLYNLIVKRRTIRKFKQTPIRREVLKKIINAGRLAPSAANLQFIEYLVVDKKELVKKIFPYTRWAGYLRGKGTPKGSERPGVYVIVLINKKRSIHPDLRDIGAAVENIQLAGLSFGIASCFIGSIDKIKLRKILGVPSNYIIDSVVALGYPKQKSKIFCSKAAVKYKQDTRGNLIVPKRRLSQLLFFNSL